MATKDWIYVTGCDSGFGKALTMMLVESGFGVFPGIYLEASGPELHAEASKKSQYKQELLVPIRLDVTNEESVTKAAESIASHLGLSGGKLVGLVNNAGILVTPGPVEWTGLDVYKKIMNVNLYGIVRVTNSVLPLLRQSQGRIVNVASIAGQFGLPGQPAYCASKFAVEGYSDCLRKDVMQWGVTVHIIEPGVFGQTGLYQTWEKDFTRNWDQLPDSVKKDYGEDFMKAGRKALNRGLKEGVKFGNTDASVVPKAMLHALTDARPKYRYRVGNDSAYVLPILRRVSEGIQDTLIGFDAAYPKRAAGAPKNGTALAKARYASDYTPLFLGGSIVAGVVGTAYFVVSQIRSKL